MVETVWATPADASKGPYKLDNIPFYTPLVTSAYIVLAEYNGMTANKCNQHGVFCDAG